MCFIAGAYWTARGIIDLYSRGEKLAIVTNPLYSSEASGNMGALNYTTWKGKAVVRSVGVYTDPDTADQQAVRADFKAVVQAWSGLLSVSDRQRWKDYARTLRFIDRLGRPWQPGGYHVFVSRNMNRATMGLGITDVPIMPLAQEVILWLEGAYSAAADQIRFHAHGAESNNPDCYGIQYWWVEADIGLGRQPIEPDWRFRSNKIGPARLDIGTPLSGRLYWGRARTLDPAGVVGNWFTTSKLCP